MYEKKTKCFSISRNTTWRCVSQIRPSVCPTKNIPRETALKHSLTEGSYNVDAFYIRITCIGLITEIL